MQNLEKLKNQYNETINELIQLIGDKVINLILKSNKEFDFNQEYIIYHTNEEYNIKSVFVFENMLYFNVDVVTTDCEGNIIYIDDQVSLNDIPLKYTYVILNWIYKMIKLQGV